MCRNIPKRNHVGKLNLYCNKIFFFFAFRVFRAAIFVALGLISALPIIHFLIENGISDSFEKGSLTNLLTMGALYITGAGLYAARIPERFLPGKCDIWFQSHQIFHLLVSWGQIIYLFVHLKRHNDIEILF